MNCVFVRPSTLLQLFAALLAAAANGSMLLVLSMMLVLGDVQEIMSTIVESTYQYVTSRYQLPRDDFKPCKFFKSSRKWVETRPTRRARTKYSFFTFLLLMKGGVRAAAKMTPYDVGFAYSEPSAVDPILKQVGATIRDARGVSRRAYYRAMLWREKRRLQTHYPPWDTEVLPHIDEQHKVTPPCDSQEFFGRYWASPPTQDSSWDPILEDPIYGDSPYLFDEDGYLFCLV